MKILTKVLLIVAGIAVVAGIVIACILIASNKNFSVKLNEDGTTSEELTFSANGIAPGETKDFVVDLRAKVDASYNVELEFVGDGSSEEFVRLVTVTISCGDLKRVKPLEELIGGDPVNFSCKVKKSAPYQIKISYTLSKDAKNEIQGKSADFTVMLTATRV